MPGPASLIGYFVPAEFAGRMAADACVRIVTVEAASREAGWSDHWVELLAQKPACKP